MAVLLSDDFNRANSTVGAVGLPQIGPAPTYPIAGCYVNANQLSCNTSGANILWDLGTANVEVSVQVNVVSVFYVQVVLSSGGEVSLTFSLDGNDECILFLGGATLWTRQLPTTPAQLKVSYRGKAVRMYADGVLLDRVMLDYPLTGTKHGLRLGGTGSVRVDNVLAVDAPVLDDYPLIPGSVPAVGLSSTAATSVIPAASIYKGRDTKTLDANPGA